VSEPQQQAKILQFVPAGIRGREQEIRRDLAVCMARATAAIRVYLERAR
jgi:hypothetical protein